MVGGMIRMVRKAIKHPEQIEETWPETDDGGLAVSEIATTRQGALAPFGDDVHPPIPLERHGRQWAPRRPGTERHDTEYEGDNG